MTGKPRTDRRHADDDLWTYVDDVEIDIEQLAHNQRTAEERMSLLVADCQDCRSEQCRARSQWAACLAWVVGLSFIAVLVATSS